MSDLSNSAPKKKMRMLWICVILTVMVSRSVGAPLASDGVRYPWVKDYILEKDKQVESEDGLGLDAKGKKSKKLWVLVVSGHSLRNL